MQQEGPKAEAMDMDSSASASEEAANPVAEASQADTKPKWAYKLPEQGLYRGRVKEEFTEEQLLEGWTAPKFKNMWGNDRPATEAEILASKEQYKAHKREVLAWEKAKALVEADRAAELDSLSQAQAAPRLFTPDTFESQVDAASLLAQKQKLLDRESNVWTRDAEKFSSHFGARRPEAEAEPSVKVRDGLTPLQRQRTEVKPFVVAYKAWGKTDTDHPYERRLDGAPFSRPADYQSQVSHDSILERKAAGRHTQLQQPLLEAQENHMALYEEQRRANMRKYRQ